MIDPRTDLKEIESIKGINELPNGEVPEFKIITDLNDLILDDLNDSNKPLTGLTKELDDLGVFDPIEEDEIIEKPIKNVSDEDKIKKFNWNKLIEPRDFDKEEIKEIHNYIDVNVPATILNTTLPITDNVLHKIRVFTITFRLINGAKNYVEGSFVKRKLETLLKQNSDLYAEIYEILYYLENKKLHFGNHLKELKLKSILTNYEKNFMVNNFIDIFLLFAEKQSFIDINKVTGFNLEYEEGKEAYKKLTGEDV